MSSLAALARGRTARCFATGVRGSRGDGFGLDNHGWLEGRLVIDPNNPKGSPRLAAEQRVERGTTPPALYPSPGASRRDRGPLNSGAAGRCWRCPDPAWTPSPARRRVCFSSSPATRSCTPSAPSSNEGPAQGGACVGFVERVSRAPAALTVFAMIASAVLRHRFLLGWRNTGADTLCALRTGHFICSRHKGRKRLRNGVLELILVSGDPVLVPLSRIAWS